MLRPAPDQLDSNDLQQAVLCITLWARYLLTLCPDQVLQQHTIPGAAQRMKTAPEGLVLSWLLTANHQLPHQACAPAASQPIHASLAARKLQADSRLHSLTTMGIKPWFHKVVCHCTLVKLRLRRYRQCRHCSKGEPGACALCMCPVHLSYACTVAGAACSTACIQ